MIRNTVVDGQTGAGSAVPNERSDLPGGTVPLNSTRWMIWDQRFMALPTTNLDRWQIMGPNEIHGSTLDQATVMPEVSATKRYRLNANAGLPSTRYFDLGAITLGAWHQYKFGIFYTQGGNGWIELWQDGVRVYGSTGRPRLKPATATGSSATTATPTSTGRRRSTCPVSGSTASDRLTNSCAGADILVAGAGGRSRQICGLSMGWR